MVKALHAPGREHLQEDTDTIRPAVARANIGAVAQDKGDVVTTEVYLGEELAGPPAGGQPVLSPLLSEENVVALRRAD